ncbi:MAG: glycosyltransferase family 4 protein [Oscillospiraceae bacterium]|nr:glycosyltransferase family 4 protein [Oscillospiraceae bacterium]
MKNKKQIIVINGKFLSQNVTGVQRYAREILLELDKLSGDLPKIVLLTDKNARDVAQYRHIRVEKHGALCGNLWEQITLPFYAIRHRALCVSLCNMAPILTPHIVVIHDVSYKVNKQFFSKKFSLWYNFVFSLIIKHIKAIVTVSEFSKSEILRCYKVDPKKISITYNGWQHYERIIEDKTALEKYGLVPNKYYFSMSSMAPNKNFKWIAKAAKANPDVVFAVSGAINNKVFGNIFDFDIPENLKFLGYVSDEEAKTLTHHCKAFLLPSYYEGFGIPSLEAISMGTKAVVSDRSCMREIFGDCAYYISPDDPDVDLEKLLSAPHADYKDLLQKYSWKKSAEALHKILKNAIDGR